MKRNPTARRLMAAALAMLLACGPAFAESAQETQDDYAKNLQTMMQAYRDVILGKRTYVQCGTGSDDQPDAEATFTDPVTELYNESFDAPAYYDRFCLLDLDADAYPEILLALPYPDGCETVYEILRYEDGTVYGFYAGGNRAVEDVTLEGNVHGSDGAMDNGWYRMRFAADRRSTVDVCRMASYDENGVDYGTVKYFIGGEEASESDYQAYTDRIESQARPTWLAFSPENVAAVAAKFE